MSARLPGEAATVPEALAQLEGRVKTIASRIAGGGALGEVLDELAEDLRRLRGTFSRRGAAGVAHGLEALERTARHARQVALDENAGDIVGLALTDLHADIRSLQIEASAADSSE